MLNEKKFHKLIESQQPEKKEQSLNVLKSQSDVSYEDNVLNNGNTSALIKSKRFIIPAVAVALCIVIAVTSVILVLTLGKSKGKPVRFYSESDYEMITSDNTIKYYSEQTGKELLYLDWYDETEYYDDSIFALVETGEYICMHEALYDMNTGYFVSIYVTDTISEIDFLEVYSSCKTPYEVNRVKVLWTGGPFSSIATFEYKDCKYYIKVESRNDQEAVLPVLDELLS